MQYLISGLLAMQFGLTIAAVTWSQGGDICSVMFVAYVTTLMAFFGVLAILEEGESMQNNSSQETSEPLPAKMHYLTADEKMTICELHDSGKNINEIAKLLNRPYPTIYGYIRQLNGDAVEQTIDKGKIIALNNAMWSVDDIAFDVGCSTETVMDVLKEADLI